MLDIAPRSTNNKRIPCATGAAAPHVSQYLLRWLAAPLFALAVLAMTAEMADARRLGGGRSFGSKPSYSSGYKKEAPAKETAGKQQSATENQKANPGTTGQVSRPGGLGGMFGGLLMGGLIGSLLFGGGFGGGMGLLDLILMGIVGYLFFTFIRSRRTAAAAAAGGAGGGSRYAYAGNTSAGPATAGRDDGWASLRSVPETQDSRVQESGPDLPEGFDQADFLAGAKTLFARLQSSWDQRDLEDIRLFTSSEVMSQIELQAADDPTPGRTDLLMVDARVLEVRRQNHETVVTVLFDVLLREDQEATHPEQVREVWHMSRDESAPIPEWKLEGIQQLEV